MTRLMRTSEIAKRPVVTMGGEDIAQVKDVVYAPDGGAVSGFTLAGRGLFAGPRHEVLPWASVVALGADAVMVTSATSLDSSGHLIAGDGEPGRHGDILGSRVLTDGGTDLGQVVDVVVEVGPRGGACDVVGYEIEASESLGTPGSRMLIPLPDTIAASGEHLMVPTSAKEFVRDDLAGFGAAVQAFRDQLEGGR